MSQKLQLFQQIFSLYNSIVNYVKVDTPDIQIAIKTLKGLYNQYDSVKDIAYQKIVDGIKTNWPKYSHMLNNNIINIKDIFSIITDQLDKNNKTAMLNMAKLQPLSKIVLDSNMTNKVKKIINNIGIIVGVANGK